MKNKIILYIKNLIYGIVRFLISSGIMICIGNQSQSTQRTSEWPLFSLSSVHVFFILYRAGHTKFWKENSFPFKRKIYVFILLYLCQYY